ncbi:MAG: NAD(P)-dependent oxidoreductase, partial [Deltaproteobacteria bacterium]|nr:NAD(P)-dependent oxidoreductase [Deltaproteobacteria bacterium]
MTTKRILVSGGTGFIGQAVARALVKKQYPVRILSRQAHKAKILFPSLEIVEGDVAKPETLGVACEGVDLVIQCAQFPGHPFENKRKHHTYFEVDALGTENLAKAAKAAGAGHFIYLSGAGTDGKKTEPWFKAKWFAEQAIHGTGLPATILRPSWVYGPGDRSLNTILKMAKIFPLVALLGGGKNHVQPIYVEDLANIVLASVASAGGEDRLFDVGGPQEFRMKTMLKIALKAKGIRAW